jgi:hypothetical protein
VAGGQCVADGLVEDRTSGLILAEDHVRRGAEIVCSCHLQASAMLNKGMADPQWQRRETLLSVFPPYGGSVGTLRDLRDRHGLQQTEVLTLAAAYPRRLSVTTINLPTGRPSEVLMFTFARQ